MHHGVDEVTRARSLFHLTPSLPLEEIGKLTKVWQRCQVARNSINKKIKNKPNFLSCLFDGRRGRRISKLTMNNVFHPREQTRSLQTCGANGWAVRNCGTTVSPFSFFFFFGLVCVTEYALHYKRARGRKETTKDGNRARQKAEVVVFSDISSCSALMLLPF